jgi:DNA-binding response OmpR family regulator
MITAYGDEDTRARALKAGAAGFLTKPIDFTLLREEITERLNSFKSSVSG